MKYLKHLPVYLGVVAASYGYQVQAQQDIAESVGSLSIEEIIVTARKTEESIQDIPFSIQAITDQQIAERDYRGLEDIARSTPGFTFESGSTGGASANPVIRGLTNSFTTTRIQNVSTFLNGIYLQRQSMINTGLLDVQRIEVLKGPQSALFGRNAFSGAINYITTEPSDIFGGKVSVTMGDDDRRDYKGSVTGTIIEDLLTGSFAYGASEYDGHTKNDHPFSSADPTGFNTEDDLGGWDNESFSTALRLTPRDDLTLGLDWYHTDTAQETQPFYVLRGAQSAKNGLTAMDPRTGTLTGYTSNGAAPNPATITETLGAYTGLDTNCNSATFSSAVLTPVPSLPFIGAQAFFGGTGNTLWCGKLPYSKPGQDGFIVDPRSSGTVATTDLVTFKANWEINDEWLMEYQYGNINHNSFTNGGAEGTNSLTGSYFNTLTYLNFGTPFLYPGTVATQRAAATVWNGNPNSGLDSDSHELRFEWSGNDLISANFGFFYNKTNDQDYNNFFYTVPCDSESNCNLAVNADIDPAPGVDVSSTSFYRNHGKQTALSKYEDNVYSAFASLNFVLTDDLSLQLEGRYTEEDKSISNVLNSFGEPVVSTATQPNEQFDTFYFFSPRTSLQWQVTADSLAYFTIAKGDKTGGFNNTPNPEQQSYDGETNWTYEIGSKNTFFDNSLVLNGAIYYVDWKDIQGTEAAIGGNPFTANPVGNIGDATNMGLEVDGLWNVTENWSVDGGFSVQDPEYGDITYLDGRSTGNWACDGSVCPVDGNIEGNQVFRTSKEQAFAGLNYRTVVLDGWGMSARIDTAYQSKQYVDQINVAYVPSRTVWNANLTLQAPNNWEFTLWGKNIFDKEYAAFAFTVPQFNQYVVSPGAAESYGLTATYNFD